MSPSTVSRDHPDVSLRATLLRALYGLDTLDQSGRISDCSSYNCSGPSFEDRPALLSNRHGVWGAPQRTPHTPIPYGNMGYVWDKWGPQCYQRKRGLRVDLFDAKVDLFDVKVDLSDAKVDLFDARLTCLTRCRQPLKPAPQPSGGMMRRPPATDSIVQ